MTGSGDLYEQFTRARGLTGEARAAFLAEISARDPDRADELREMLAVGSDSLAIQDKTLVERACASLFGPDEQLESELEDLGEFSIPSGRLEERGLVGRGAMGEVRSVWDVALRREVARKTLRATDGSKPRPRQLARLLAEARVTGGLQHPGIVPVHDLGVDPDGTVFFTMQKVQGRDLSRVYELERAGDPEWSRARALGILQRVCEAMAYAHSRGVVHRDLKPANVMVGEFGEVYVMDWGVALGDLDDEGDEPIATGADARRLTRTGTAIGTPCYMSPEQAAGLTDDIDHRSDVYALGAMLYELLVGIRPYEDHRDIDGHPLAVDALLARIAKQPPTPIADLARVPPELEAICSRAMARKRSARYADMKELASDLRAFLEDRVVRAHRTGALVELRKWVRRNRLAAAAILLTVLSIVTGFVVWYGENRAGALKTLERDHLAAIQQTEEALAAAAALGAPWLHDDAAFESWLRDVCAPLLRRRVAVEATIRDLRAKRPRAAWEEFLLRQLESITPQMDRLESERVRIEQLRSIGPSVRRVAFEHPNAKYSWSDVREALGRADGVVASTEYAGFDVDCLDPQNVSGLVPLGMNAQTRLWEFYDLYSAWDGTRSLEGLEIPALEPDGKVQISAASGVVFVLIPGGTFTMGVRQSDFVRLAPGWKWEPDEHPAGEARADDAAEGEPVVLDAFFASRFELTRAQWMRMARAPNPSLWVQHGYEPLDLPVDNVTWIDADAILRRSGMHLPTEAQWEYLARAGTDSTWFTGDELAACKDFNLCDQSYDEVTGHPWTDGHSGPAPAGWGVFNRWGIHNAHGNLWEWCEDWKADYANPAAPGTGLRVPDPSEEQAGSKVVRGGALFWRAIEARSTNRNIAAPTLGAIEYGIRPTRRIPRAGR